MSDSCSIRIRTSTPHESELVPSMLGIESYSLIFDSIIAGIDVGNGLSIPNNRESAGTQRFSSPRCVLEFESESAGQIPVVVLSKGNAEAENDEHAEEC